MATPYKVKSFTIASGATESSPILHSDLNKAIAIARISIDALTPLACVVTTPAFVFA